jgi:hypothetical protein
VVVANPSSPTAAAAAQKPSHAHKNQQRRAIPGWLVFCSLAAATDVEGKIFAFEFKAGIEPGTSIFGLNLNAKPNCDGLVS